MSTAAGRTDARDEALRVAIVAACRRMESTGLARGTAGNISARCDGGLLITPSAVPYDRLEPGHILLMDADGTPVGSDRKPSSEWRMHMEVMRQRPDVGAIVHTHSPAATALACLRRPIPAFHYMVAIAGGADIPCAPYARFGTAELATHTARALRDRDACLLANHGAIAVGRNLERAFDLALQVEGLAAQYAAALQLGEPVLLSAGEMAEALAAFAEYRDRRAIAPPRTRGLR